MATKDVVVKLTLDPRYARLLERQEQLQAFLLGKRPADMDPEEMAAYIRTQSLATVAEVIEVLDETHWKPWSVRPDGQDVVTSKKRYTSELADVFIFLMNLMLVGEVTSNELADAVNAKQEKNLERWVTGYNAKTTKCPGCGRSYDDDGVKCYKAQKAGKDIILAFCQDKERFIDKDGEPVL